MKKIRQLLFLMSLIFVSHAAQSQVDVVATSGTLNGTYTNLSSAFTAINSGTHQGDITIEITASFTEVATSVLNSNGVGSALYTSVLIRPTIDGATITFATAGGRGVIELNGADNITIDGDNPNTSGINRNLTFVNSATNTTTYTSVIRIATGTGNTTADNITIKNVNVLGNATGRNLSSATSTTGSENTTFGIIVGPNGGASPTAITSVTGAMAVGNTSNNILIDNCSINQCARGIAFIGNTSASSTGVIISNNIIGEQSVSNTTTGYPFTNPSSTVYTKGIYVQGTNAISITGNTLKNIISYVGTPINAIELNSAIGTGTILINNNTINTVALNTASGNTTRGISVANAGAPYTISGNTISNIQNSCNSTTTTSRPIGLFISTAATSAMIENNKVSSVYDKNTGTYGVTGVFLNGGNNITFRNNFVTDVNEDISGGIAFSTQYGIVGVTVASGTGHKIYNNTIHLSGAMLGTSTSSILTTAFAITGTGLTGIDVRNNIFSNILTGGTTSIAHTSVFLPSGATSAMNLTFNNNQYYSGTDAARHGIAQVGTTAGTGFYLASNFSASSTAPATNLRAYTSTLNALGTNDNASGASSVVGPFISSLDLHINDAATNVSDLDAKAVVISGLTTDIDGDLRNITTPDIGADEFTPSNICSGTPSASITNPSSPSVCSGVSFILSLSTSYTAAGFTYQWQSSPDGIAYSNVTGATGSTYSTTQSTATYYQCIITCTNSGMSVTSTPVQVNMNLPTACYCTPAFSNAVEPITLVNFAGLNNSTSNTVNGTPALEDFTSLTANVTQGVTYPITLKGNTAGTWTNYMTVFIDFNQNGSFADAGEAFNIGTIYNSTGVDAVTLTGNITIPVTALAGTTRMRVMKLFGGYPLSCNTAGFGQGEDYSIAIAAAPICSGAPTAGTVNASSTSVCSGTNVTFNLTGYTTDLNITYQWQSSPDGVTYSNISGANGTSYASVLSTPTYFQCVVTCTTSGQSSTTTPVFVNINPVYNCYCAITFPTAVEPITLVNFAGINNTTSNVVNGTPALENFTSITGNVNKGYTYPIILKGNTAGNFTTYLTVYIDFNQNGSFLDAGETFNIGTITNSTGIDAVQLTGNITIPMSALTGMTGMRVVKKYSSVGAPCNTTGYGQAEDYTLLIAPCVAPSSILLTSDDSNNEICPSQNVTFTATSGYAYYDFQINSGSVQTGTTSTYSNSTLVNNDAVTVIAGYDATCATTSNVINIIGAAIPTGTIAVNNISCNGLTDGSLDLTVTAGLPGYTYSWSNLETTEDISSLAMGNYDVTITDANGCVGMVSASISEPAPLVISSSFMNVSCNGFTNGSIDITVSGGAGGNTFAWDNSETTEDISNLSVGNYSVVVTDMNSCVANASFTISEPNALTFASSINDVSCNGGSNGSIDLTITGGTMPYTFDWDNDGTGDNDDAEDLTNVSASNYSVIVIDFNGCNISSSNLTVAEPTLLTISLNSNDITCNGLSDGSIDMTVSGGVAPYIYDWDNDGTGDNDDIEDLSLLSAGTYNITVIDFNGCTMSSSATINEPVVVTSSTSPIEVSCFGLSDGSIDLTISGGTSPYTFDWDNDGTGDNDDAEDLSNLTAGTYSYVVTDANGCMDNGSVNITEPSEIILTDNSLNISCNGLTDGSIDLTVSGGTSPYTFDWDNDGTGDNDDSEDLTNLSSSSYSVIVTDNNNCTASTSISIVEPNALFVSTVANDISCNGLTDGSIDITVLGGTSPYTFDWDNDGTGDNDDTEDLSSLASGNYSVTIVDANGCPSISTSATINEPSAIVISAIVTNTNCDNTTDGAIDLTTTGGTGAITYLWNTSSTDEDLTGLSQGTYSVTATDANGCSTSTSENISFNNVSPNVTLQLINDLSCSTSNMVILGGESPSGGVWSGTAVTGSNFNPNVAGIGTHIITYTFTDGNGCSNSATDNFVVDDCSGVEEIITDNIKVYPNPTTGIFTLTSNTNGKLIIYNAIGQVVYTTNIINENTLIDLTMVDRGVYYISLETELGNRVQKLVKD